MNANAGFAMPWLCCSRRPAISIPFAIRTVPPHAGHSAVSPICVLHVYPLPKKLIEVALPLDDINVASAREKSIRHGHPSTLHLWWARRPLAAARAVIFAQMVNDPGGERGYYAGKNQGPGRC